MAGGNKEAFVCKNNCIQDRVTTVINIYNFRADVSRSRKEKKRNVNKHEHKQHIHQSSAYKRKQEVFSDHEIKLSGSIY